ncbi:MAG: hypothetical protein AAF663_02360 [Planctomycetota bacterium]
MNDTTKANDSIDRYYQTLKPGDVCIHQPRDTAQSIVQIEHVGGCGWTGRLLYCTERLTPPLNEPDGGSTLDLTRIFHGRPGAGITKPFNFTWIAVRDCQYGTVHVSKLCGLQPGDGDDMLEVLPLFDGREPVTEGGRSTAMRGEVHLIATDDSERLWSRERLAELDRLAAAVTRAKAFQAKPDTVTLPADLAEEPADEWVDEDPHDLSTPAGRADEASAILELFQQLQRRLERIDHDDARAAIKCQDIADHVETLALNTRTAATDAELVERFPDRVAEPAETETDTTESEAA